MISRFDMNTQTVNNSIYSVDEQSQISNDSQVSQDQSFNFNTSQENWTYHNEVVYFLFINKYKQLLNDDQKKQSHGVCILMSKYIKTKSFQSCWDHHRKYKITYHTIDNIIKYLLDNFYFDDQEFKLQIPKFEQFFKKVQQDQNAAYITKEIQNSSLISSNLQEDVGNQLILYGSQIDNGQFRQKIVQCPLQLIVSIQPFDQQIQANENCKLNVVQLKNKQIDSSWFIKSQQTIFRISSLEQCEKTEKENVLYNQQHMNESFNEQQICLRSQLIANRSQIKLKKPLNNKIWRFSEIRKLLIYIALHKDQFQTANKPQKCILYKNLQQYLNATKTNEQCRQKIRSLMKGKSNINKMLQLQLKNYDIEQKDIQNAKIILNKDASVFGKKWVFVQKQQLLIQKDSFQSQEIDTIKIHVPFNLLLHFPKTILKNTKQNSPLKLLINKKGNSDEIKLEDNVCSEKIIEETPKDINVTINKQLFELMRQKFMKHKQKYKDSKITSLLIQNKKIILKIKFNQRFILN